MQKIMIASDQGGFEQKELLKKTLSDLGFEAVDMGVVSADSVDYPDVIYPAVKTVSEGAFAKGIILCGTGIGASIVANKVRGIRAALVTSVEVAILTREHNDSNILALAGRTTDFATNEAIVAAWLGTEFSKEERHKRRIHKIEDIETKEGRL